MLGDYIDKFGVHFRNMQRARLGLGNDVKGEILYTLAGDFPLKVQVAK